MAYETNSIFWVDIDKVVPNPYQPRKEFNESRLQELADSIRMYGLLQPLTVIRQEVSLDDGAFRSEYELIAGERRLRASKLGGLKQVPVIIRTGEETDMMKLELAIIENLQREDLNPIDRAMALKQLTESFKISHKEVAKKVGRSRMYVSNTIRLLQLPDTIMSAVSQGEISEGHARTLLMLNDKPEEQDVIFREILLKKLSVREVEQMSRKVAQDKVRKKEWKDTNPELIEIERKFTDTLGTRVSISKTHYGGKVVIDYFSDEDLQKLLESFARERAEKSNGNQEAMSAITAATALEEHQAATEAPIGSTHDQKPSAEYTDLHTAVTDEITIPADDEQEDPETAEDDSSKKEQEDWEEEDDDLYSMKNFSL